MSAQISLVVGGAAVRVAEVTGHMAVCEPFAFRAIAPVDAEADDPARLLGLPYTLQIGAGAATSLFVTGVTTGAERRFGPGGTSLALELGPATAPLAIGQTSRAYQDKTIVQIVDGVLASAGAPAATWRLGAACSIRPYVVQYAESDWAFIERLCREEGIVYWFELGADDVTLVFSDDSTRASPIDGDAALPFRERAGMERDTAAVFAVTARASISTDAVVLADYDPTKPRARLVERAARGGGRLERYDYPGGFTTAEDGARAARRSLEAFEAGRRRVLGRSEDLRIVPGRRFTLTGHPIDALDGPLFCVGVRLRARAEWWHAPDEDGADDSTPVEWEAVPADGPFRLARANVSRRPAGPQTGAVCGPAGAEIHTDDAGRVRVQPWWDRDGRRDERASTPMRVGQVPMGHSMIAPRVGWDMLVEHHDGDVEAPFVVSHLYDGEHAVPYALPAHKTRSAWQTATTPADGTRNEIRFDDKKGLEELLLDASRDMTVVVGDAQRVLVGRDYAERIGADERVSVGGDAEISVQRDRTVDVGGDDAFIAEGARQVRVGGADRALIGESQTSTAEGGHSLEVAGARAVTTGGTAITFGAQGITRSALGSYAANVGSAWINAAGTGLDDVTLGASVESVGGAKIVTAAKSVEVSASRLLAETAGGAYVALAGGSAHESSGAHLALSFGGALLANARRIEIEATSKISIRVGASTLTLNGRTITVKSPSLASTGTTIVESGARIRHN